LQIVPPWLSNPTDSPFRAMPESGYPFAAKVGQFKPPKWASSDCRNHCSRRAVPRQLQGVLGCGLLHDLRQAAQPDTNLFNRTVPDTCREIHGYIGDFKSSEWWFSTSSLITSVFRSHRTNARFLEK